MIGLRIGQRIVLRRRHELIWSGTSGTIVDVDHWIDEPSYRVRVHDAGSRSGQVFTIPARKLRAAA